MPCTYTGSIEGDRALVAEESIRALKESRDEMTALACRAFRALEKHNALSELSHEDNEWWLDHKLKDNQRLFNEQLTVTPKGKKNARNERENRQNNSSEENY